jgi:hypothetical protein
MVVRKSPLVVLRRACKNNGSFSPGQRLGKRVIFQEGKYELQQHQRSSHAYQVVSQ